MSLDSQEIPAEPNLALLSIVAGAIENRDRFDESPFRPKTFPPNFYP
jgi:hypothetical protein